MTNSNKLCHIRHWSMNKLWHAVSEIISSEHICTGHAKYLKKLFLDTVWTLRYAGQLLASAEGSSQELFFFAILQKKTSMHFFLQFFVVSSNHSNYRQQPKISPPNKNIQKNCCIPSCPSFLPLHPLLKTTSLLESPVIPYKYGFLCY